MKNTYRILVWCITVLMVSALSGAYEIVGDSVLYSGEFADLVVTPHTAYSPVNDFEQTFTVTNNKNVAGDLCVAYYFNNPLESGSVSLKSVENYNVNNWISDVSCDTAWDETNQTNVTTCTDNGYYETVQKQRTVWNDVSGAFTHLSYNGKHYYYSNSPLSFSALDEKSWKLRYSPNTADSSNKWGLKSWNSQTGNCYNDFINQDYNFMYDLDPWWNSSWDYSYSLTPSIQRDNEVYNISIVGTICENNANTTAILDSTNTTEFDYVWHNSSRSNLAFVGDNSSVYFLYCDDDLKIPERNNSNKILRWMDCDGTSTTTSDWALSSGDITATCQSSVLKNGANSLLLAASATGAPIASLNYTSQSTGNVTITGWYARKAIVSYEGWFLGPTATDFTNAYWIEDNANIRWYDTDYRDTGFDSVTNGWFAFSMSVGIDSNLGRYWQNNTLGAGTPTHRGTVSSLKWFGYRATNNAEGIYLDDFFICDETCHVFVNPATLTIGAEQTQLTSANESTARTTITSAINNVLTSPTIYTVRQMYVRYYNGNQSLGTFDKVAVSGNQRWAFNYITGSDTYTNMWNLTSVFYVLEMANLTSSEITVQVETLINNTLI
ncbi:hypothetical protein HQ533_00930 [Candidatus Woesearchaeota archaeon]|nr:hypothetical protein [Candidatus Woesearchaeota archaeon]